MQILDDTIALGRRAFLKHGSLFLAAANLNSTATNILFAQDSAKQSLRFGVITDLHHADKPPAGSRFYRETIGKLAEAADQFKRDKPSFVVELGDLIDAADSVEVELSYLARINREFSAISENRHYVLGNHCVDTLTKQEFLDGVEKKRSYYSFDNGGFHFVVLDSCFRTDRKPYGRKNSQWTDANIPGEELEWLSADLAGTSQMVVVFAHQRLDVNGSHSVKNAVEVRRILEKSSKVLVVFQGHSHQNDYQDIAGIHYCTMVAMIEGSGAENSGYSTVDIQPTDTIRITGFRRQKNYDWQV
jgi:alkaline phosphatase